MRNIFILKFVYDNDNRFRRWTEETEGVLQSRADQATEKPEGRIIQNIQTQTVSPRHIFINLHYFK